jgi:hypothetical protein
MTGNSAQNTLAQTANARLRMISERMPDECRA